ncbi:MAG: bifunctional UDP-N-acetylglucosamine diphosphorylase/glucosamine-1-phosphate N-acetyltransferase GlmU [Devosiaceae bacterium]|nr:bifunctional UDP-N-acetylglucosamine diphosphorylase/glucosamine-1-phosphate N-acetyltransferase GlmU [Devosiaceae bacterium]
MDELTTIILAAGDGTRMRSSLPKLLHPVAGMPIVGHVINAAIAAGSNNIAIVTAPGQSEMKKLIADLVPKAKVFEQKDRLGTAHAAKMAKEAWKSTDGYIAVVYGDHPLLQANNFSAVLQRLDDGFDAAILGFEPDDPSGYGRFIVEGDNLLDIVEHKDANEEQLKIGLSNACILTFKADVFRQLITKVDNANAQSEYYLPDLVKLANIAGFKVGYAIADANDVVGVNSRPQLAHAEMLFQQRLRENFMENGVTLRDPQTTYFSFDSKIASDVTIEPNVVFGPDVNIEQGVLIKAFSHIEGAHIGKNAIVGPFARLRPGADLAANAKVGNFCEVKNAQIGEGAKVNHLSYIGDATIGKDANIGAGTITCNYDGFAKYHTEIGEGASIGSNTSLIAPVYIGDNAIVGAGSTIIRDVKANELALTRTAQTNKKDYAPRLRASAKAKKDAMVKSEATKTYKTTGKN